MLIRSQDKRGLYKFDGLKIEHSTTRKTDPWFYINRTDDFMQLGKYSSEKKALKVLDMVQDAYVARCFTDIVSEDDHTPFVYMQDSVFIMPQDNDVTVEEEEDDA